MRLFNVRMWPGLRRAVTLTYGMSAARPSSPSQFSLFDRREKEEFNGGAPSYECPAAR